MSNLIYDGGVRRRKWKELFDEEDIASFKEEIKVEYDCQIAAASLMGILMKTH